MKCPQCYMLHRGQLINKYVNIKLTIAVVGHVFLCTLEDRRNQDFLKFVALVVTGVDLR